MCLDLNSGIVILRVGCDCLHANAGVSSDCARAAETQPRYVHLVAVWRLHSAAETLPAALVLHTERRLLGKHCELCTHTTWQAAAAQRRCSGAYNDWSFSELLFRLAAVCK